MAEVTVTIDGKQVSGPEGMSILEAAETLGIAIPTLCHRPEITPTGACRVCVVEVEGSRTLVGSCHTPISEGMVIHTHSAKVIAARKATVELLLAAHTGPCVTDEDAEQCELHKIASELEVGPPRFQVRERRFYPIEELSPYVQRDMSRCILCRRCIRACSEVAKKDVFAVAYRGFHSKVIVDFDEALNKEVCKDCGVCIDYCPTSALSKPKKGER
jgi:NADH dehydrogenase/NADH:ubiquinone oxidoreductase subunit G